MPQPFQILKMDRRRGNIVVSRRTVLEETRAEQRQELVQNLEEGQVIDGVVKNITDYGAFVDLGGIDGLLHVTDIAWRRVNHPTEVLNIGQQVKVKIIKINHETHRISLGMKQLLDDPWQGIEAKYPVGARFKGRVTNITDYGAFVELEPGIEGLIHVSEMSWTKKNVHPGKIVSTSQEVEVQVLEVDPVKRRISLGLKQTMRNPWEVFVEKYPAGIGSRRRGQEQDRVRPVPRPRRRRRRHGASLRPRLETSGRAGDRGIQEGRQGAGRRCSTSMSRRSASRSASSSSRAIRSPPSRAAGELKKGAVVTCEVTEVKEGGIDVKIVGTDLTAFIKRAELARDRAEQRPERFAVGQKVDARVIQFDRRAHKVAGVDQGAGSRGGEGGDRPIRLLRFGRDARRHPRHRAQARAARKKTKEPRRRMNTPASRAPGAAGPRALARGSPASVRRASLVPQLRRFAARH